MFELVEKIGEGYATYNGFNEFDDVVNYMADIDSKDIENFKYDTDSEYYVKYSKDDIERVKKNAADEIREGYSYYFRKNDNPNNDVLACVLHEDGNTKYFTFEIMKREIVKYPSYSKYFDFDYCDKHLSTGSMKIIFAGLLYCEGKRLETLQRLVYDTCGYNIKVRSFIDIDLFKFLGNILNSLTDEMFDKVSKLLVKGKIVGMCID